METNSAFMKSALNITKNPLINNEFVSILSV